MSWSRYHAYHTKSFGARRRRTHLSIFEDANGPDLGLGPIKPPAKTRVTVTVEYMEPRAYNQTNLRP